MPVHVVLDNVRSMANVGAFFRTSDAFLVEKIWLGGITAQPPHREIEKAALGATQSVAWEHASNLPAMLREMQEDGKKVFAVEQGTNALTPSEVLWSEHYANAGVALVFGNEVMGVADEIVQMADALVEIPQGGTKHSFNVAVSAGIVLWECWKAWKP